MFIFLNIISFKEFKESLSDKSKNTQIFQNVKMPFRLGAGRNKDPTWDFVSSKEGDTSKVVCDFCYSEISKKIERVKSHMNKCHALWALCGPI